MRFLTSKQIKSLEEEAIKNKTVSDSSASLELINNAADACVKELLPFGAICVFCGKGNNGADGYAIAAKLKDMGKKVYIAEVFPPRSWECGVLAKKCRDRKIPVFSLEEIALGKLPPAEAAVEAIFGIGFKGPMDETGLKALECINKERWFVLSVDIPGGLDPDSGRPLPAAVMADKTVTFTAPKMGFAGEESADYCGEIVVADVGVGAGADTLGKVAVINKEEVRAMLPKRRANSHKGTFGRVLMFAGSNGMVGAAALAGRAAMRSGCGLVTIACLKGLENVLNIMLPEAVVLPVEEYSIKNERLKKAAEEASAVLIGCGTGKTVPAYFIKDVIEFCSCPVVVDADGLNALAPFPEGLRGENLIITPHPLEFSRLTGKNVKDIQENRINYAADFAKNHGVTLVLKGARTVVSTFGADASDANACGVYVSLISTSALAKAGSGDVLAGVTAALCAQGLSCEAAAGAAVYIHSVSGRICGEKFGEYSTMSRDIADNLIYAFMEVEHGE